MRAKRARTVEPQQPSFSSTSPADPSPLSPSRNSLQSELMSLMMSPPAPGISAFPESDSDLTYWVGRLEGPEVRCPLPSSPRPPRGFVQLPRGRCVMRRIAHAHTVLLARPQDTPYAGQTFAISLRFPSSYPMKPPQVRFESTCFHPNVDLHGNICLDILKEKWSPALSVSTVLVSLQSLLGGASSRPSPLCSELHLGERVLIELDDWDAEPNNKSPLNVEAADLWDDAEAVRPRSRMPPPRSASPPDDRSRLQFKKEADKHYKPLEDDE